MSDREDLLQAVEEMREAKEWRDETIRRALRTKTMSVIEIANLLGYSRSGVYKIRDRK